MQFNRQRKVMTKRRLNERIQVNEKKTNLCKKKWLGKVVKDKGCY